MNSITDIYWNVIQELLKKLNYYEENYAYHITKVLPNGNIYIKINLNYVNFTVRKKKKKEDCECQKLCCTKAIA